MYFVFGQKKDGLELDTCFSFESRYASGQKHDGLGLNTCSSFESVRISFIVSNYHFRLWIMLR